jgi:hypothetical protein
VIRKPSHHEQEITQSVQENHNVRCVTYASGISKAHDFPLCAPANGASDMQLGRLDASTWQDEIA